MGTESKGGYWENLAVVAAAVDGDREALTAVLGSPRLVEVATDCFMGAALAIEADRQGREAPIPEAWKRQLQAGMAFWLLISEAASSVAGALDDAAVKWMPIKGFDIGTRFYRLREERPITDLDVLIAPENLDAARDALEAAGWIAHEASPRARDFVMQEGYTCHFSGAGELPPVLVEIHFRLWGFVPEGLAAEIVDGARPGAGATPGALRVAPEHAYLIAAVHGWTKPPARDLVDWRDLSRVLESAGTEPEREAMTAAVVETSRRWSLELPVCLSSLVAARLWPGRGHEAIVDALEPTLKPIERRLSDRLERGGIDAVPLSKLVLARLLAGRASRAGWRSVWRRVWAHPGVVELETADDQAWSRRRAIHLGRSLFDG